MTNPLLTYFQARGRAELIRLVCAEAGIEYDEHPVLQGAPPQNGRPTDFQELKQSGLLPFSAVPIWEDPDGFRLAQSLAIVKYLGAQHGLMGKTSRETALVEQRLGAYEDVRAEPRKLVTTPPAERPALHAKLGAEILPRWLGYLDRILASNRDGTGYLVGDSLTVADLALWYLLEIIRDNGWTGAIEKYPRLQAYFARIGARPRLAAYLASPKRFPFAAWPRT
jgi:glutathione S-transferase